jgi:hypothetical protein
LRFVQESDKMRDKGCLGKRCATRKLGWNAGNRTTDMNAEHRAAQSISTEEPISCLHIGVVMRYFGEHGSGVSIDTNGPLDALFTLSGELCYTLLYRSLIQAGRFAGHARVREVVVPVRSKLWWVPVALPRADANILLNLEYLPPLLRSLPSISLALQGFQAAEPEVMTSAPVPW